MQISSTPYMKYSRENRISKLFRAQPNDFQKAVRKTDIQSKPWLARTSPITSGTDIFETQLKSARSVRMALTPSDVPTFTLIFFKNMTDSACAAVPSNSSSAGSMSRHTAAVMSNQRMAEPLVEQLSIPLGWAATQQNPFSVVVACSPSFLSCSTAGLQHYPRPALPHHVAAKCPHRAQRTLRYHRCFLNIMATPFHMNYCLIFHGWLVVGMLFVNCLLVS